MPCFYSLAARVPRVAAPVLATAAWLACAPLPASSASPDVSWTGGAGLDQPFWDLAHNWRSPAPPTPSLPFGGSWIDLGANDTTLRYGSFGAGRLTGTGRLTITGGELTFWDFGSNAVLGALRLEGGFLVGTDLSTSSLYWSGGGYAGFSPSSGSGSTTVTGDAHITGSGSRSGSSFVFSGHTVWDSTGWIRSPGQVHQSADTLFEDRAASMPHTWEVGHFGHRMDGRYVKSGAGASTWQIARGADFANNGTLEVREGTLTQRIGVDDAYLNGDGISAWANTGTLRVSGGTHHVDLIEAVATHAGQIDVESGSLSFTLGDATLTSTGDWNTGRWATLRFVGAPEQLALPSADMLQGNMNHQGLLAIENARVRFAPAATLAGLGDVAVGRQGVLEYGKALALRTLSIGSGEAAPGHVRVAGNVSLHNLAWGHGTLSADGPISVEGQALLNGSSVDESGRRGKRLDTTLALRGSSVWEQDGDLHGTGALHIERGAVFEAMGGERTGMLAVAVRNAGRFMARDSLVVGAPFENHGWIGGDNGYRVALTFRGGLANLGTMSLEEFRIDVQSPGGAAWRNEGRIQMASGEMHVAGGMINAGQVVVAGRREWFRDSLLQVDGGYVQQAAGAETWVDGLLYADAVSFEGGVFGAGLRGHVGLAELQAQTVSFGSGATLHLDLRLAELDQIQIDGAARLGGLLDVSFLLFDENDPRGTYRFLTASSGVLGNFDAITSSLDPSSYRLTVLYGDSYAELQITAVPEPKTYTLMAAGLLALWGVRRRRRS
jgi:hypothetical protein